jgi:O-antigen ligase
VEATSTTAAARPRFAALDLPAIAAFALGSVLVGWVAADDGGWWPETWAWTALVTLGMSILVLILRDRALGWLDLMFVGGLLAFGVWTALSAFWSPSVPSTLDEAHRVLAYVGAVLLGLLVVDRRTVRHVLGGTLAAIALIGTYALATRLLPDRVGDFQSASSFGYRLAEPVTYWNGLAIFLVMGILLALGFAARGQTLWTRSLAAATLPVLTPALYFTFSRGAWIALIIGVVALVAIDPRRLQLLALGFAIAPFSVLAAWLGTRADGLRRTGATLAEATQDGHALVWPVLVLAAGSALVAVAVVTAERRIDVPSAARTVFAGAVLITLLGLGAAAWNEWGSPIQIADRLWEDFQSTSTSTEEGDLGARLFHFSSNGRVDGWRVALDEWQSHPAVGLGAGTYWESWAAARPISAEVRDAHGLYFETLAELGVVGLVLLLVALLVPTAAALGTRETPLVSAAFGAYVAWLVHAGVDWDWELLGVTLTALLVGGALVAPARTKGVPRLVHRWMLPAATMMLTAPALNGVLAYASLASAREALNDLRLEQAAEDARSARRFAPWASAPWEILGDALAQDDPADARNAYREALERDGSSWELWLALAAISSGEEQRVALARAARLNPLSGDVRQLRDAVRPKAGP